MAIVSYVFSTVVVFLIDNGHLCRHWVWWGRQGFIGQMRSLDVIVQAHSLDTVDDAEESGIGNCPLSFLTKVKGYSKYFSGFYWVINFNFCLAQNEYYSVYLLVCSRKVTSKSCVVSYARVQNAFQFEIAESLVCVRVPFKEKEEKAAIGRHLDQHDQNQCRAIQMNFLLEMVLNCILQCNTMYFLQITSCVSCHSSCIMQCILVLWGALKILLSFLVFTPWICLANFSSPRRRFFFFLWEAELFFLLSLCPFHNTKRSRLRSRSFHQLYSVVRHAKRLQLLELLFFRVIVILQQNNRSREWRVR